MSTPPNAKAAEEAEYQKNRAQAVVIAAGVATHALLSGTLTSSSPISAVQQAFIVAEAFIAEAEKRLGGKIPF